MRDNELYKLIFSILRSGFTLRGMDVSVSQSYQPTQQGTPLKKSVFVHKLYDHRYGHMLRKSEWDLENEVMNTVQSQWYETTFQIDALAIQDPADVDSLTASDLVNTAAQIMQVNSTLETLRAAGVGILRIQDVRNPYFTDDRGRFEASPSFDFTLTHEQVIISQDPVIVTEEFNIARV